MHETEERTRQTQPSRVAPAERRGILSWPIAVGVVLVAIVLVLVGGHGRNSNVEPEWPRKPRGSADGDFSRRGANARATSRDSRSDGCGDSPTVASASVNVGGRSDRTRCAASVVGRAITSDDIHLSESDRSAHRRCCSRERGFRSLSSVLGCALHSPARARPVSSRRRGSGTGSQHCSRALLTDLAG